MWTSHNIINIHVSYTLYIEYDNYVIVNVYMYIPFTTTSVITQRGETALMIAASKGRTEVVVELVKAKANLDLQNNVSTCYYEYCM